jgi:hypothetical protein
MVKIAYQQLFFKISCSGSEKTLERPYTPVLCDVTDSDGRGWANVESLFFLIKIYPLGAFTQALSTLKEGTVFFKDLVFSVYTISNLIRTLSKPNRTLSKPHRTLSTPNRTPFKKNQCV